MARQKKWQDERRDAGLCRQCGRQPPRLRRDGKPASKCADCYRLQQESARRRRAAQPPPMTPQDEQRLQNGGRLPWEAEPPPTAYLMAESAYLRWHYRQHGRLPWESAESDGRIKRILRRITGGGDA